jgi:hypothetical protein
MIVLLSPWSLWFRRRCGRSGFSGRNHGRFGLCVLSLWGPLLLLSVVVFFSVVAVTVVVVSPAAAVVVVVVCFFHTVRNQT